MAVHGVEVMSEIQIHWLLTDKYLVDEGFYYGREPDTVVYYLDTTLIHEIADVLINEAQVLVDSRKDRLFHLQVIPEGAKLSFLDDGFDEAQRTLVVGWAQKLIQVSGFDFGHVYAVTGVGGGCSGGNHYEIGLCYSEGPLYPIGEPIFDGIPDNLPVVVPPPNQITWGNQEVGSG